MPVRVVSSLAATALALSLVAGCSSGSSKASAGGGTKAQSATQQSGATSGKPIKVCDVMPVADVAKLSGLPLTKAVEDTSSPEILNRCAYKSADGSQEISISTHVGADSATVKSAMTEQAGVMNSKPVTGVGDAAYFSNQLGVGGLSVLYGVREVDVRATQELSQDVAVKIAEAFHAKL